MLVDVGSLLEHGGAPAEHVTAARRGDLVHVIEHWPRLGALVERAARLDPVVAQFPVVDPVGWLPPVRPSKIACVALNNRAMDADRISAPDHPAFFLKSPASLIGHGEAIVLRPDYGLVHPEPELAVVIGRRVKDADNATARAAIFGVTILNDVTSVGMRVEDHFHFRFAMPDDGAEGGFRVVEHHTTYAGRYKSADTFGPLGPVVATVGDRLDPDDLAISCTVDGETVQDDRTSSYRYRAADAVAFISRYQTLLPGDVVSLGTAIGSRNDRNRPLSSVDLRRGPGRVAVTIEGIGTLVSSVELEGFDTVPAPPAEQSTPRR
ncbi:fumarylacetoacetate hydrolase family protein [Pseudonocardia sp. NPDC049635]|uniref:fumarylacetoacetate hydrolase family protein n=1 Tax=Pseudonocardia sp. NPDC049635 TaxID=3155506 RepID=UPI0033CE69FE